jgi:hypothetical protein
MRQEEANDLWRRAESLGILESINDRSLKGILKPVAFEITRIEQVSGVFWLTKKFRIHVKAQNGRVAELMSDLAKEAGATIPEFKSDGKLINDQSTYWPKGGDRAFVKRLSGLARNPAKILLVDSELKRELLHGNMLVNAFNNQLAGLSRDAEANVKHQ